MSIEWIAGTMALISLVATVYFIVAHVDIPREWWMLVMGTVLAKIFGSKNGKSNGG